MKRTLLTLLCAFALAVSANAETALVSFIKTVYEGDVTYEETFPAEDGINDKVFNVGDVCSFVVTGTNTNNIKSSNNSYMEVKASCTLTITPKTGVTITNVYLQYPSTNYIGQMSSNQGTCETMSGKVNEWNGTATTPIDFTFVKSSNGPQRIQYMLITYTTGGSSAIETVAVDVNAPVKYYNLEGVEVANPSNGLYIRQQGNNVAKVIK